MLDDHKKVKILIGSIFLILILVVLGIEIVKLKGYSLIYDWMYFAIIYIILVLFILLSSKNKYLKWVEYGIVCIIFIFTTIGLIKANKNKVFVFKSPNFKNEIIIKEAFNNKYGTFETLDLKRRWHVFAKEVSKYPTQNSYKSFSSGTYKVNWITNNIAVVNYLYSKENKSIKQHIYTFNLKEPISYNYVAVSITGKWKDKKNPNNTFASDNNKIIYIKDGKSYRYTTDNAEQKGFTSVIFKGQDSSTPDLSIVFNEGDIIGNNCLLNKGATIFIGNVSLKNEKYRLFEKIQ